MFHLNLTIELVYTNCSRPILCHMNEAYYTQVMWRGTYVRIKVEHQYQPLQVRSCYININNKSLLHHRAIMNSAQLAHILVCIAVMLLLGCFFFWCKN